tara:strand:+ start:1210 stop:1752 length:543 start_codon:yes stop_codon:yes gene_type:complete
MDTLSTTIQTDRLQTEMDAFLGHYNFWELRQISLTSLTGDDDWTCSVGSALALQKPERMYSQLNKYLEGTYMGELIKEYNKYYRWRLLHIPAGQCYSVHSDAYTSKINKRIHIPITTNPDAYFCYYGDKPADGLETTVTYHHMPLGSAYEVNTSQLHSAINYGKTSRYHMVGVRYEKVDK